MSHYDFATRFRTLYDLAVSRYAGGKKDPENFFSLDEVSFLAANGIAAQHVFDYAEDHLKYQGPGPDIALSVELVRRDYFLNVQLGRPSAKVVDASTLPGKTDAVHGITWLPRLLPKARAKLRGELPSSLMYCCGGDRAFFQEHDIQPGEFLNLIWRFEHNDAAVVDWVVARSRTAGK